MATKYENMEEIEVTEPIFLTKEESQAIRESEAREKFGMSAGEFFEDTAQA